MRSEPLIYCHFAKGVGESRYHAVSSWESLNQILEEALESYNELNAIMNLVLFEDAMQHVYVKDILVIRVSHIMSVYVSLCVHCYTTYYRCVQVMWSYVYESCVELELKNCKYKACCK